VKTSHARLAVSSAVLLAAVALNAQDRPPAAAFRFERPIAVTAGGPHRLTIDVPLLVGGRAFQISKSRTGSYGDERDITATAHGGVTDLRLFDGSGREVAYLLVDNPTVEPTWREATAILRVAPVETEKEKTSGFEADLGQPFAIDRFRIDGLSPPFLKRIRLEGSGDRARWTVLVD
jgi:hypothetical protein